VENLDTVQRLLAAAERDDVPAALACLNPELDWVPLRAATEGAYHGHEGFEQFVADTNETFEPRSLTRQLALSARTVSSDSYSDARHRGWAPRALSGQARGKTRQVAFNPARARRKRLV
jgi:ketosteroid isomerase-like protein